MVVRPLSARALALITISLAVTAAAAPASTAAALTPATTVITARADSPTGWVPITDPASGISVMLPDQPTVKNTTTTAADGGTLPLRQYLVQLNGGDRAVLFQVIDAPFRQIDFGKLTRALASFQATTNGAVTNATVTNSRDFVLDGRPANDARITATIEGTPAVMLVRLVADDGYIVGIMTLGRATEENALISLQQQVLGTLHLV
jgi:ABC-type transport system substrate-binding protein